MPITSSAKKALRQSVTRRKANNARKEAFKNSIKKFQKLLAGKDMSGAKDALKDVFQKLDKAAKTNVIHKNKASRMKSNLAKKLAPAKA